MSSDLVTASIIGSQESRVLLKKFAEVFATGISVWEDRLPIPEDEPFEFREGLRWSLEKQGFNRSNSGELTAMWQALDESTIQEGQKNSIEVTYSSTGGLKSSWELRLPESVLTSTTLDGGSVNWALLTGRERAQHLAATFDKARRVLLDGELDVTEETPLTVVFVSSTDDPCILTRSAFYNFGLQPDKKEVKGVILDEDIVTLI